DPTYTELELVQLRLELGARVRIGDALEVLAIARTGLIDINVYPGSKLDEDRTQLHRVSDHGEIAGALGLVRDTRDHGTGRPRGVRVAPSLGPGAAVGGAYGSGGAPLAGRGFLELLGDLTLGARLVGDILWGEPPFDELTRVGGLSGGDATGGSSSIRG